MDFTPVFRDLHVEPIVFGLDDNIFNASPLKVFIYIRGSDWLSNVEDKRVVNVTSSVESGGAYFCFKHVSILVRICSTVKVGVWGS